MGEGGTAGIRRRPILIELDAHTGKLCRVHHDLRRRPLRVQRGHRCDPAEKRLPARTNAPVTIDGDYVITAGSDAGSPGQRMFIVAYKLGARGKLPGAVSS